MDQQVQVKSITSTEQALLLSVGMVGAFFVGLAMILAPVRALQPVPEPVEFEFGEMTGWPKPIDGFYQSTPLATNLDADSALEIVQGGRYKIYAFDNTGKLMKGWPYDFGDDSFVWSATSATNLDSDPQTEIVVATAKWWGTGKNRVYVFNHDGTLVDGWPLDLTASYNGGTTDESPAIGDIDNDGMSEIVLTSSDAGQSKILALEGDGTYVNGWPIQATPYAWNQPVIEKIHGENRIVTGSRNELNVLNGDGTSYGCFPHTISDPYIANIGQIAVGDLDNDATVDFVFLATNSVNGQPAIHAYNIDCEPLEGWPYVLEGQIYPTGVPAIGDIDTDGAKEVVFKSFDSNQQGSDLLILNRDGSLKKSISMVDPSGYPWFADFSQPSLADIDGDKKLEILGMSNWLVAWNEDGSIVPYFPVQKNGSSHNEVVVADVDADGVPEIVFTEYNSTSYIHVYNLPFVKNSSYWTQSRHDAQNTGLGAVRVTPTCVDTDGGNVSATKGTVSGVTINNVPYSTSDVCVDGKVMEQYCTQITGEPGSYPTADLVTCANGCSDGACVQTSTCTGCNTAKPPACCGDIGGTDPINPAL